LAYEAERAGTLEIFTGHTVESLVALYELYKFKLRANRYGDTKEYEFSHICSVQGHATVGLFHPLNLVVAPKLMNRVHGVKHFGHGLSIDRKVLKSRHSVEKGANRKDTAARIITFIGTDVVAQAAKLAGIQPSRRNTVMAWLRDHLDPYNPLHRDWLDGLDDMSGKALKELREGLEGKKGSDYKIQTIALSSFEVLSQELARHALHRPELTDVLDVIHEAIASYTTANLPLDIYGDRPITELAKCMPDNFMTEAELQALFDVLHGKPVNSIRDVLEGFTERYSNAKVRIPAYAPIVFTRQKPAINAPVTVLAVFKDFAGELDAQQAVSEVVPVLRLFP
jgi:hypothetical protein